MKNATLLNIVLAFLLTLNLALAETQFKRKGRYVRTDTEKTVMKDTYSVKLVGGDNFMPAFQFRKLTRKTVTEVKMYETILEIADETQSRESVYREQLQPRVIPNEFIPGERSTRTEIIDGGVFANETFMIDGIRQSTDQDGKIHDVNQLLMQKMDNLSLSSTKILIQHDKLEPQFVTITRDLLKNPAAPKKTFLLDDSDPSYDLPTILGLDFTQLRQISQDGLFFTFKVPDKIAAGQTIDISVEAQNYGRLPIGAVLMRTFSRETWLNGKLFYFGNLKPGQKLTFTRKFTAPAEFRAETSHVMFAAWDLLGAQTAKNKTFKIITE